MDVCNEASPVPEASFKNKLEISVTKTAYLRINSHWQNLVFGCGIKAVGSGGGAGGGGLSPPNNLYLYKAEQNTQTRKVRT